MATITHSNTASPMRTARQGALAMAFAWAVIGGSVGLNALIKSNQQKSKLRKLVPQGTTVDINTNDVFKSGIVLTTVCALIAVLCLLFGLFHLVSRRRRSTGNYAGPSRSTLLLESLLLGFCALWLFATLVPFTLFFATRSARVRAFQGGVEIPSVLVEAAEKGLGQTSVYNKIGYLRLVAILPWITFLFTTIAAVVLFLASVRAKRGVAPAATGPPVSNADVDEKKTAPAGDSSAAAAPATDAKV